MKTFTATHGKADSPESKVGVYFSVLYGDMIYP